MAKPISTYEVIQIHKPNDPPGLEHENHIGPGCQDPDDVFVTPSKDGLCNWVIEYTQR
ncbi:MAG: hypothetical protein ACRD5J_19470 [Nitrososphaeraceae archaeon]